jgi:hypothetical protein
MMKVMATTAQNASVLLGKLRTTFGSVSAAPATPVVTPSAIQPVVAEHSEDGVAQLGNAVESTAEGGSTSDKLTTLEQILTEVEQQAAATVAAMTPEPTPASPTLQTTPLPTQPDMGLVAQATPTAVDQAVVQQQPQVVAATPAKETFAGTGAAVETTANAPVVEAAAGVQYVEQEPVPEIPPEVAEYLTHVENHANQQPQEIVIAEQQQQVPLATNYPKQSVIVLPITPEVEGQGKTKGPFESIRWLVEWSYKMMKVFSGRIIYRQVDQP